MKVIRRLFKLGIAAILAVTLFVLISNLWVVISTKERIFTNIEAIPTKNVALVLGTSKKLTSGEPNPFFKRRMEAAARLYQDNKVKHIIVSGDNRTIYYNEPADMRKALIELGVPSEAITLDYAGLRTLDSIVRCKEIFGQDQFIIVTQGFHAYRALFISRHFDIQANAYAARTVSARESIHVLLREFLARPKAVIDLYVLNESPRHLGEKEEFTILDAQDDQ